MRAVLKKANTGETANLVLGEQNGNAAGEHFGQREVHPVSKQAPVSFAGERRKPENASDTQEPREVGS